MMERVHLQAFSQDTLEVQDLSQEEQALKNLQSCLEDKLVPLLEEFQDSKKLAVTNLR